MNIFEGSGLCDPEVFCMDVVYTNTISRSAVKFCLLFFPSLELHVFLTSLLEYNLGCSQNVFFFPTKLSNVFIHGGYILSLALVMLTVPCRGSAALMGCGELCYKVY